MDNEVEWYYNREKLYEGVWSEPVIKVAERYGVSGVAIAKTCKKMHIPVPGRGYWNKVQSGQKLKKTPLPDFDDCPKVKRWVPTPLSASEIAQIEKTNRDHSDRLVPEAFFLQDDLLEQETAPEMRVTFNPDIIISNQYVKNTRQNLNGSKKNIGNYTFGRCNSINNEAFEVSVDPENIDRAVAILQTLCDELKKRGYSIGENPADTKKAREYRQRKIHPVYAIVLDEYISFKITETSKRHELSEEERKRRYERYQYTPSGKLTFEILNAPHGNSIRTKWQDRKLIRVENWIQDIIINMIKTATMLKEQRAQRIKQEELWAVEREKQRQQEKEKKIEEARVENLIKEADRLVRIKQLKEYIELISSVGKERLGDEYPKSDFSKWVKWAKGVLEKNDPKNWELPKFDLSDEFRYY